MNKVFIVSMLYNRQPYIKLCLENLFNYTKEPFDLLLWDNGSEAPTKELLEKVKDLKFKNGSTVTIINQAANIGVGNTLHHAQKLRKAGQHFMQLDSDIIVPKDPAWLTKLIHLVENNTHGIQVIGFPQYPPENFFKMYQVQYIHIEGKQYLIYPTHDILGCCFLAHSKFFDGFSYPLVTKKIGEGCDISLNLHAKAKGIKMAYIYPPSMIEFAEHTFLCLESLEYQQWKHNVICIPNSPDVYVPSQVSNDNSPLNIRPDLLCN